MADIFISHVEEDASFAIDIAHAMERIGFITWYYERDTVPGRSYLLQIGEEIDACSAIILLISSHSLGSYQVTQEVIRAYESNKPFIPLLIDVSHAEFQTHQPEWRAALGAAASLRIPHEGIPPIIPQLVKGLIALGVQPAGTLDTAPQKDRGSTPEEVKHVAQSLRAKAEAQQPQDTTRATQQEQLKHRDQAEHAHTRHRDTQPDHSTHLSSPLKTRLWVGGSISVAFAFVSLIFFFVQSPQSPQPIDPQPASTLSVSSTPPQKTAMNFFDSRNAKSDKQDYQGALNVWFVIAGSHRKVEDAERQTQQIREKGFSADVYEPYGGNPYYAVVIGTGLPLVEAQQLRARAIKAGLAQDTYLWTFPDTR